jgi:hypothetical protein
MRSTLKFEPELKPAPPAVRRRRLPAAVAVAFVTALLLLIVPRHVSTQTAASQTPTTPLPSRILYRQLFKHVLFLDKQADYADQHGRDGNSLRNYYQRRANLTPSEAAALKQIAKKTDDDVRKIDDQIKAEIIRYRALLPAGKGSKSTRPVPPDLSPLQRQKDRAVLAQAAALQALLGDQRFQDFDAFARRELTPHIKVTNTQTGQGH